MGDESDLMLVQFRLSRELMREVDHLSIDRDETRRQTFEFLLREGLRAFSDRQQAAARRGGA